MDFEAGVYPVLMRVQSTFFANWCLFNSPHCVPTKSITTSLLPKRPAEKHIVALIQVHLSLTGERVLMKSPFLCSHVVAFPVFSRSLLFCRQAIFSYRSQIWILSPGDGRLCRLRIPTSGRLQSRHVVCWGHAVRAALWRRQSGPPQQDYGKPLKMYLLKVK